MYFGRPFYQSIKGKVTDMKVENQVTSVEQSRVLLRLGVPSEKASMAWTTLSDDKFEYFTVMDRTVVLPDNIEEVAFTVSDILDILPYQINTGSGFNNSLVIRKLFQNTDYCEWIVSYTDYVGCHLFYKMSSLSLIDILVELVEWLDGQGLLNLS